MAINNLLKTTGINYVINLFQNSLTNEVNENYVDFVLDAENSILNINSLDVGKDGTPGIYFNNASVGYIKADLAVISPYPFVYSANYPCSFAQLQQYFLSNYEIILEEGEFRILNSPNQIGLKASDVIDQQPDLLTNVISLEALSSSVRWKQGSIFKFIPVISNYPITLTNLIVENEPLDLNLLVNIKIT